MPPYTGQGLTSEEFADSMGYNEKGLTGPIIIKQQQTHMWNSIKTWWKTPFNWTKGKLVITALLLGGLWWGSNNHDVVVNIAADTLQDAAEFIQPDSTTVK